MSLFLILACFIGAILIVFQSLFEAFITPYILIPIFIFFVIVIVLAVKDLKKYGLKLSKQTTKKEQLFAIIDNLNCYHKIIDNNSKIDLIVILESGLVTLNILNVDGTIEVLDNGDLYYTQKGGKSGKINNFIDEINNEIENIKKITNVLNIDKFLIRNNELIYKENFAEGFEIKHISGVFYDLEKRKEKIFTKEEIDRMYELMKDGNNKN